MPDALLPRFRPHLFEFCDLGWIPASLRDGITDWLQQCVVIEHDAYGATAPMIADLIKVDGADEPRVVDLCSGAGGPWTTLKPQLEALAGPVSLTLTDKFPNQPALTQSVAAIDDGRTSFLPEPVDALHVPDDLGGVRTLFTAIHHLKPAQVHELLRDAFEHRVPIGVFDFCGREQVLKTLYMNIRPMLATMRDVEPRRRRTMFLTYVLPVLPTMILWDALVSNLRAYSPEALQALVADLQAPDWQWQTGKLPAQMQPVTYIVGSPVR